MRYITLFLFGVLVSCGEKEKTPYLQSQILDLAPPRLETTTTIIDTTVVLTAYFGMDNAMLRYTDNGSEPDEQSSLYSKELTISKASTYTFKAYHPDWLPSATAMVKLYKKGLRPKSFSLQNTPDDSYPGLGKETLINAKKASLNFRDVQWAGYSNAAFAKAEFDRNTFLKTLTVGYLIDTKSWIFPPEAITVIVNGKDTIRKTIPKIDAEAKVSLADIRLDIQKEVRTLQIEVANLQHIPEWHPGAGNSAWLFMDEWIFNE